MNFPTIERILLGIAVSVTCTFIFSACESETSNIPDYAFVDGKSDLVEPQSDSAISSNENENDNDIVIPQINEALDKNKDKKTDSIVLPDDKNSIQVVDINKTEEKSPKIMDGGSTYTVRKNDSLWSISMIYGVPMDYLAEINGMKKDDVLPVGKVLVIPPNVKNAVNKPIPAKKETKKVGNTVLTSKTPATSTSKKPATAASNSVKKNADGSLTYVVKKGDTLGEIALRNHVKLADLAAANKIDVNGILQIGQTLIIPANGATAAQTTAKSTDNTPKTTTTKPATTTTKPAAETKTSAATTSATTSATTTKPATTATTTTPAKQPEAKDANSTTSTPASSVNNENSDPDVITIDFTVEREVVFKDYVKSLNLNVEDVLRYNKGYTENSVLPAGTRILIPFN